MTPEERRAAFSSAPHTLSHHPRRTPKQVLEDLATWCPTAARADHYGRGGVVEALEHRVARLTGKEASVYLPSGTMAQQIALRIACDERRTRHVAFHPLSHLEIHEQDAYQVLHGIHASKLGSRNRPMVAADLRGLADPLAAILVELPQRELGGTLPTWEELLVLTGEARSLGAHVHCDGARLWECQPFYARPLAELCRPFDSVYLSFYKTLGALAGAVLAGSEEFVEKARVWVRRHGGNLHGLWPGALSAERALDLRLPRIPAYVARAGELANLLSALPGARVAPFPPPTNMFHLHLEGDAERLLDASARAAKARGILLFSALSPTPVPGWWSTEVTVGDSILELDLDEVAGAFREILGA